MICAKCHRERPSGREYYFYYGKKGPSETYRDFSKMQKVTTTSYSIAGRAPTWVCDGCVTWRSALYMVGLLLVAGMFALAAYDAWRQGNTANIYACSGIGLLFAGAGVYAVLTGRTEMGEMVAISARKKELRAQGHNAFLTTKRYESMRRSAS